MAQARRGRKRKPGPRHPCGKLVQPYTRADEQAQMRLVIEARCRRNGWDYDPSLVPAMRQPWQVSAVGRAIAKEPDVEKLWQVVCAILDRRARYLSSNGLPPDHAKVPSLPIPRDETEPFGGAPSYDPRDEGEKARAHTAAWQAVEDACDGIHPFLTREIMLVVVLEEREPPNDLAFQLRRIGKAIGVI